jgi:hypothetical protein
MEPQRAKRRKSATGGGLENPTIEPAWDLKPKPNIGVIAGTEITREGDGLQVMYDD